MNTQTLFRAIAAFIICAGMLPAMSQAYDLKITELQSPGSPLISFRIILRRGAINDPKGKEGLNALTAQVIAQGGTKDLTYSQVVDKMYPWAAGIGAQTDYEVTTFIGNIHKDHLTDFYKLFTALLLQPRFDSSDFSRVKDDALNYLKNELRSNDDEALGKEGLSAFVFRNHPYSTTEIGTVQGITSITLDDVKKYYQENYTQATLWIGVAGGYPSELIDWFKKDFGTLPAGDFTPVPLTAPEPIKDVEVQVIEKPTGAYAVSMGYPINITRSDKDFYALLLANSYFGEHRTFSGVLMNHLREYRGLNYGDYSYIERFVGGLESPFPDLNTPLRQQYFSIWLRPVQPENTHFAIRDAMYELNQLVTKGISNEDFEKTRKFLTNYSKLWAATMNRRLGYLMDSQFYGTDYYIDRIAKELSTLTADDVNAVVKKYLHPSDIKIAVVVDEGKGKDFLNALIANTPSPITYQSTPAQAILDEDKIIQVFPLKINTEKSMVVKSSELFEK
jgi:zinc protease